MNHEKTKLIFRRGSGVRLFDGHDIKLLILFSWLGPEFSVCCLADRGSTGVFLLLQIFRAVWLLMDLQ